MGDEDVSIGEEVDVVNKVIVVAATDLLLHLREEGEWQPAPTLAVCDA